jgi:hypothetical protein
MRRRKLSGCIWVRFHKLGIRSCAKMDGTSIVKMTVRQICHPPTSRTDVHQLLPRVGPAPSACARCQAERSVLPCWRWIQAAGERDALFPAQQHMSVSSHQRAGRTHRSQPSDGDFEFWCTCATLVNSGTHMCAPLLDVDSVDLCNAVHQDLESIDMTEVVSGKLFLGEMGACESTLAFAMLGIRSVVVITDSDFTWHAISTTTGVPTHPITPAGDLKEQLASLGAFARSTSDGACYVCSTSGNGLAAAACAAVLATLDCSRVRALRHPCPRGSRRTRHTAEASYRAHSWVPGTTPRGSTPRRRCPGHSDEALYRALRGVVPGSSPGLCC